MVKFNLDLTDDQAAQFRDDGFLIVENIIDIETVKRLRERMDLLFKGHYESGLNWRSNTIQTCAARYPINLRPANLKRWTRISRFRRCHLEQASWRQMDRRSPWTGMLRCSTA